MLKRFLTNIKEGGNYNAIELFSTQEKEMVLVSCFVNTKMGLERGSYSQIEKSEFDETFVPRKRAFLVINTNNVVTKIEKGSGKDGVAIVHRAFPNLKLDEFFYEITYYKNSQLISICRKSYIYECLEFFKQKGITITGFSLGVSKITVLIPFIDKTTFLLNNIEVADQEEEITIKPTKTNNSVQKYDIQGMLLTGKELLGFANVVAYIKNIQADQSNFKLINMELKEEGTHNRLFSIFFNTGIAFILVILIINFLFFNHYYSKTESLRQIQQVNRTNKSKIMTLNQIVKDKEKMIDDVMSSSSSQVSYYMDALAYGMPEEILLNTLDYQPLIKEIKVDKEIHIKENELTVMGISSNNKVFSSWIESMESYAWIEGIEITAYDYSKENASDFSITISIRDEK